MFNREIAKQFEREVNRIINLVLNYTLGASRRQPILLDANQSSGVNNNSRYGTVGKQQKKFLLLMAGPLRGGG